MRQQRWVVVEAARDVAVQCLANLGPGDWRRLQELATAHTTGALSPDAWSCASSAIVERSLRRYETEGRMDFTPTASG